MPERIDGLSLKVSQIGNEENNENDKTVKLEIQIDLPDLAEIISQSNAVPIVRETGTWSPMCLGKMREQRGVYVIHHAGKIKYVGKTDGPAMSFGRRLRAEFREKSSRGKHVYPKLSGLQVPPDIMVRCFPADEIERRMIFHGSQPRIDQIIALFEVLMINHLDPEFQRHYINAAVKRTRKIISETMNIAINHSQELLLRAFVGKQLNRK